MASMVFASSPLSAQSLVKLRTNSNYPRSSCYVPLHSKTNSYVHLSCNISHIESSKSSFTKGDGFSKFSVLKFPRVASTLSPSLNTIKASMVGGDSIYHFNACKLEKNLESTPICLDVYRGNVLLIVNIPQQGSDWSESEIKFLNELHQKYNPKGFEVLGFLYDKNELGEKQEYGGPHTPFLARVKSGVKSVFHHDKNELDENSVAEILKILRSVEFPIFMKVELNKEYGQHKLSRATQIKKDEDLWYFLRHTLISDAEKDSKIKEEFEKILVNRQGIPYRHYPRFDYETTKSPDVQSGGNPGSTAGPRDDPYHKIENEIAQFFKKW